MFSNMFNIEIKPMLPNSLAFVIIIIYMIVLWRLFVKANYPGWTSLIPGYNLYIFYKITWGNGWWSLVYLLLFFTAIGYFIVPVFSIITCLKLAKVYGRSFLFGIGLIFFNLICMLFLAFDNSEYVGI